MMIRLLVRLRVLMAMMLMMVSSALAWTTTTTTTRLSSRSVASPFSSTSTTVALKMSDTGIPPPAETDTEAFTEYASRQSPPRSFFELQQDCVRAIRLAINDGLRLLEVEFPPLPANVLEMDDVSAYDVSEANLNLAIDTAKGLLQGSSSSGGADSTTQTKKINKVAILFPDEAECEYVVEKVLGGTNTPAAGVVVSSLRQSDPNDDRIIKPEQLLLNIFGKGSGGSVKPIPNADVYICLTASAQELPDIEELYNILVEEAEAEGSDETNKSVPIIITYNMKLDILRGDLGNPAFPGRDLHDRFLSRIKPVYYLRTRQYSRSTPQPPFIVNYQGCLFRSYPGKYQTLLDTGTGRYRRLLGNDVRPALGEFKEQLTDALKEQGILQDEGETINFLRTGYKTSTWWEEYDREDASKEFQT